MRAQPAVHAIGILCRIRWLGLIAPAFDFLPLELPRPSEIFLGDLSVQRLLGTAIGWHSSVLAILLLSMTVAMADVYAVAKTKREIADTKQEMENLRREIKPKAEQLKSMLPPIEAERQQLQQYTDNLNGRIDSFNGACAGRPKNGSCESTRSVLIGQKQQSDSAWSAHGQRVNQYNTLQNEVTLGYARFQKLANYLSQLEARLEADTRDACRDLRGAGSAEAMKNLCGNVQFDGASIGLPPCTTDKCRQYDAR